MGRTVFGILVGLLLALSPAFAGAGALPVAKRTLADRNAIYEIAITYPQTGDAAIDADILKTVNRIAAGFRKEAVAAHDDQDPRYTLDVDYVVARNDPKAFAVIFNDEWDFHGAHPNLEIVTANYLRDGSKESGGRIFLPELFDGPRGLARLSALVTADLDKRLLGPDGPSDKGWIARGADAHWDNFRAFVLLPDALEIEFPPYQVAAYAEGPQTSRVALAKLKDVMRANPRTPTASFECAAARTPDEHAICSDMTLARLDRVLNETWSSQMRNENDPPRKARRKAEQIAWLKNRAGACQAANGAAHVACLTKFLPGAADGAGGRGVTLDCHGRSPLSRGRCAFCFHCTNALRSGRITGRRIFRARARVRESYVPQGFLRHEIESSCQKTGPTRVNFVRIRMAGSSSGFDPGPAAAGSSRPAGIAGTFTPADRAAPQPRPYGDERPSPRLAPLGVFLHLSKNIT